MKCKECGSNVLEKVKTAIIDGVEYDAHDHDKGTRLKDISIPGGWRLWRVDEIIKLHNNEEWRKQLNLEECWFFIEQPFEFNKKRDLVTRFGAGNGGILINYIGLPQGAKAFLGVRFCRDVK